MKFLKIFLQIVLCGYISAASASVKDEYNRRENELRIKNNNSLQCLQNQQEKGVVLWFMRNRDVYYEYEYDYVVVNGAYLEIWENCNIVRSYEFGTTYNRGPNFKFELELFYEDEELCASGRPCRNYFVNMYVKDSDEINLKTLPSGIWHDDYIFWKILYLLKVYYE